MTSSPCDSQIYSQFNVLNQNNQKTLKAVLDSQTTRDNPMFTKAITFYDSCLDTSSNPQEREEVLLAPLAEASKNLTAQAVIAQQFGINAFFSVEVGADDKEVTSNAVFVSQGGLSLGTPETYQDASTLAEFTRILTNIFTALEADSPSSLAQSVVSFESNLSTIFVPEVNPKTPPCLTVSQAELRDPNATYNKMTIAEFQTLDRSVNWDQLLTALTSNANVDAVTWVVVQTPSYFARLAHILNSTTPQVRQGYVEARAVFSYASALFDEDGVFQQARSDLRKVFTLAEHQFLIMSSC